MIVRRQPEWLTASINGDVALINRKRRSHFIVNRVGARIWEILETPRTIDDICDLLLKQFNVTPEFCRDQVEKFLREMDKAGVIARDVVADTKPAASPFASLVGAVAGAAKTPEQILAFRIGNATLSENIEQAIEAERLVESDDGRLQLGDLGAAKENFVYVNNATPPECDFLIFFLYKQVYKRAAIPLGCSQCYKVKVVPTNLRGLVAGLEIAKAVQCYSKWGLDLDNIYSQSIYAGYFYVTGLDMARIIFRIVREAVDADPRLGPGVGVAIKRGCSDYEAEFGPSNEYEFAPELAEIEAYLKTRFKKRRRSEHDWLPPLAHWIDAAFRIGDETYLDFTAGQTLRAKSVTYAP